MISTLVKSSSSQTGQNISKQPVTTCCNSTLKSLLSTYQINISNWKETGLEQEMRIQICYDADEPSSGSSLPSRR